MPSTTSRVVSMVRDSSTVMTPSLPTFFIASAMILPMVRSLLALMVATCSMASPATGLESFLISSTTTSTAFSTPRLSAMGLEPAATFFRPSRKMHWASTVAVVVPSPATSEVLLATSRTICAPMFSSGSFNSISLATVTPSFVMVGDPYFLSITTLRPLGPSVTLTAFASWLMPRSTACRELSPYTICLAIDVSLLLRFLRVAAADDAEDVLFSHDEIVLTIERDLLPRVLAEQDEVTRLHIRRSARAVVQYLAGARGDHLALLRLFLGGVGDDDSANLLFTFLEALDDDAIVERS